ncbi:TPA: GBS Bsp-like repeat-containing protein [Streptococcus suis]|nr:GBS Bsp-like repeat-containing protein [Streptococcus suis]
MAIILTEIKEGNVKKKTIFLLSVCAIVLSGYVVQADSLEASSQLMSVPSSPEIGGQLSVIEEAGQMKAVLSHITGEIIGVTGQFKSSSNSGKTIAFTIDAQGQYVAYLNRSNFSDEDQIFTLALVVNLLDGSSHSLDEYTFSWIKATDISQEVAIVKEDSGKETTASNSSVTSSISSTLASTTTSGTTISEKNTVSLDDTNSASTSLAKLVTSTQTETVASASQILSSVGTQLQSASMMRAATNTSTQSQTGTTPSSVITEVAQKNQILEIKYTRPISSGEVIKFAVWSEKNSQDDLIWYDANQTGAAYVDLRKHRDYGKYQIHTYANRNGKMVYLDEVVFDVEASGKILVSNIDSVTGTFDVNIENISAPLGLSKVLVPTWTKSGGQDDIVWYEAQRQTNGNYKVTVNKRNHKNGVGDYNLHLYYKDSNGNLVYITETIANLPEVKLSGDFTILDINPQSDSFKVRITNIVAPNGISKVLVPTWTESGGQDDIKWYEASRQTDGSYILTVNRTKHNYEAGKYNLHLYYKSDDGSLRYVNETVIDFPSAKASGTITVSDINQQHGTFKVRITNVLAPNGISKVLVPIWTDSNGQDDIKWYEANRQTDGSYLLTINKAQHKYGTGKYNIHLYYRGLDNRLVYVTEAVANLPEAKVSGNIKIIEQDNLKGIFKVRVTDIVAPNTLSKVIIPTWTEFNGQDDIKWYEASIQADGSYLFTVNKAQHKYETGKYNIHVYYRDTDGRLTFAGSTTTELAAIKSSGKLSVSSLDAKDGTFNLKVSDIVPSSSLKYVEVVVWSQKNPSDLKSYNAVAQSDGTYAVQIDKKNHSNNIGDYQVSVYYVYSDYKDYVTSTVVNIPSSRSYTIYIDPGHGGSDSGASYDGIYEKNLAMSVANKLKANLIQMGYQVLMTRTADYDVDFKTERSRMANQSNADLFISIHFNATGLGKSSATGIETYWYQYDPEYQPKINQEMHNNPTRLAESEILANQVQTSLIRETGAVNRGVRRETFAVLRETAIPAILVELGFMDNPSELQKIKQEAYHTKLAKALATGIDNWYSVVGSKPSATETTNPKNTVERVQMTTSQQAFFNKILPTVQQVSKNKGIVTSVMLAQTILESAWGTSQLATNANNIFGIKADVSWKGNTYTVQTNEVVGGKTVTVKKQFRAYGTIFESIADYGNFFTSTPWRIKNYSNFLQAKDYESALTSLLASGYATDPAYAEKLKSLILRYGLNQYNVN